MGYPYKPACRHEHVKVRQDPDSLGKLLIGWLADAEVSSKRNAEKVGILRFPIDWGSYFRRLIGEFVLLKRQRGSAREGVAATDRLEAKGTRMSGLRR